jgi:hypothetical protein
VQGQQILVLAAAVALILVLFLALVVRVLSSFVTSVGSVAVAAQLHHPADIPSTHSHHLGLTQHDRRTQTSSCYVSERLIDAL